MITQVFDFHLNLCYSVARKINQLTSEVKMNLQEALSQTIFNTNKVKRSKFDQSHKQLKSFYRKFNCSLLVINETPYSWIVLTKQYGVVSISKEYSIRTGLFITFIDTWYLRKYHKILESLSTSNIRR